MGYQNNSRPKRNIKKKILDILFDLSDLEEDIKSGDTENLVQNIRFIHESCAHLLKRYKKKLK